MVLCTMTCCIPGKLISCTVPGKKLYLHAQLTLLCPHISILARAIIIII